MMVAPRLDLLAYDRFPLSARYDPAWIVQNEMGPNVLWLTEFLCEVMALRQGMRVLDLGCGKAISSIFLAREFDVQVWATDLWIPATDNANRIREAGLEASVFPIHADARNLPYADAFFDAIVSVDAFEYFGTDVLYLPSLVRYLKPGGQVGIVNAGVNHEVEILPAEWPSDFCTFHTPEWWRRHWSITRCVNVEVADHLPEGRALWLRWNQALGVTDDIRLTCAAGENLAFHRIIGRK
jgi:cyclopropane fatty-acyl-phospholipid synthase-like methyltransferase